MNTSFSSLSIRAQNPPVSGQNTSIPKSIQYKAEDISVDQQNVNAADYICKDFRCRAELEPTGKLLASHDAQSKNTTHQ